MMRFTSHRPAERLRRLKATALLAAVVVAGATAGGCADADRARGICLLIDRTGSGHLERHNGRLLINQLLGNVQSNDTLAVIDVGKPSEGRERLVAQTTFGIRPLTVNRQKRAFAAVFADAAAGDEAAQQDVSGSLALAADYLSRTECGRNFILIYSDLRENREETENHRSPLQLDGFRVIAIDVAESRGEDFDLRAYLKRLALWRQRVESSGGTWRLISDYDELTRLVR